VWEREPAGQPYKVTELTPVFGCCMGLRSDISGCRYCLCEPCKVGGEQAIGRSKRVSASLQRNLNRKEIECVDQPERHLKINLVKEHNGSYFKEGGAVEKSYPKLCCGCFRPFTA